jgi:hypothetical protein
MLKTAEAVVRDGRIELLEPLTLTDGTKLLVTVLPDEDEHHFWSQVSDRSLADIWDNTEDDVYAELLKS